MQGQTIAIEYRYAEGRAPRAAPRFGGRAGATPGRADLCAGSVSDDVAAKQATSTVPIVALDLETDPVASGLVASLGAARGATSRGMFSLDMPELSGKWLQLLQEAVAVASRVAVLGDLAITPRNSTPDRKPAAQALAVPLQALKV